MIAFKKDGRTLVPFNKSSREWILFYMFAVTFLNADQEGFDAHIDWIRARFHSPDEYLGPEGDRFRSICSSSWANPSTEFIESWRAFKLANCSKSSRELTQMLQLFISG